MFKRLVDDIDGIRRRDPAARSRFEVMLAYPGLHAVWFYRIANWFWRNKFHLLGRWTSHWGRWLTGIEIHPGATIGRRLFIDHGMGVVIGETAEVGDDVTLYHGVTLGGTSPAEESDKQRNQKRHPTLERGVIVGSGAQILGPITVGADARVGANAVVTKDVPAGCTAIGIPARLIACKDPATQKEFVAYGTPGDLPDPVQRALDAMRTQMNALAARVEELEGEIAKREAARDESGERERQIQNA
ncbi:MAG: serine O-acetyltransferase [Rhodospirillaceae bacterium]|nr:serine O-acetyltransferase [Rhodospirillaceae bacterium]